MTRITVLGGTGYAGNYLVKVAAERGHEVTSYSRKVPIEPVVGVEYLLGDARDRDVLGEAFEDADVVVSALSPRGDMSTAGLFRELIQDVAKLAGERGVRFGVIGGAGSLFVAEGGPRVFELDSFPEAIKPESQEMAGVLDDLRECDPSIDWFYVSPAGGFGPHAPGPARGEYRIGGDILLVDDDGQSYISGDDLALAIVHEIEQPAHRCVRFTVAY